MSQVLRCVPGVAEEDSNWMVVVLFDCSPVSQVLRRVPGVSEEECDWIVMLLLD